MCSTTLRSWAINRHVAETLLEPLQQDEHLGLNGHIERRHRLIEDEKSRFQRQRAGNSLPLALATAELMRIAVDKLRL